VCLHMCNPYICNIIMPQRVSAELSVLRFPDFRCVVCNGPKHLTQDSCILTTESCLSGLNHPGPGHPSDWAELSGTRREILGQNQILLYQVVLRSHCDSCGFQWKVEVGPNSTQMLRLCYGLYVITHIIICNLFLRF
jgi:hypothetical protein